MFCCCPEESDAQPAEESRLKSDSTTSQASGQKAACASNQTGTAGSSLNKTITATNVSEVPVTDQPKSQSKSATTSNDTQQNISVINSGKSRRQNTSPHSVEVSDIKTNIVQTEYDTKPLTPSVVKVESTLASTFATVRESPGSAGTTKDNSTIILSSMSNIEQLKSITSELDKLDKAIGEAEAKCNWEAKSTVHKLANHLKALTSQVLVTVARSGNMAEQTIQAAVSRLEAVAGRLEAVASTLSSGGQSAAGDSGAVSPFVLAYDDIIDGPLTKFISVSSDIGGDVKVQADLVKQAFDAQRSFLVVVSKSRQPDQSTFVELLKNSASKLQAVQDFRENNRKSEFFNHLSAVSESIAALGWVTVSPAPGPYVKEMADAGTFYTNRVLKDYREKDTKHVEWSRSWLSTLTEMQAYIKKFHTTGLSWNSQGGDAKAAQSSGATVAPPPPAGGPPPPPPPGPPPPPDTSFSNKSGDDCAGRAALFAEISKGTDVTRGLKKVTDDMKTHKNPTLRQGPAPFKLPVGAKPNSSPKPVSKAQTTPSQPPLTELQGKKWVVEYHKDNKNIVLDNVDLKQSVYLYRCDGCIVKIQGKLNSIVVDSCKKTGIVFDDLVSSLEFVNCQSVQAQVTGKIPTLSIDKTDGCMMYLSPESLDVEIVTAKSSEMNILVPVGNGDFKEFPLPEQFKTKYDGKTMVTAATDIV